MNRETKIKKTIGIEYTKCVCLCMNIKDIQIVTHIYGMTHM